MDSLGVSIVLSTLNANRGYRQVEKDNEDTDRTAFTSHHGLHRFTRMVLGLKIALGTFQRAMDVALAPAKWQTALVHQYDIVIFSKSPKEHITHVKQEHKLLLKAKETLNLKKTHFFTDPIDSRRHAIPSYRVETATHTTDSVRQLKTAKFDRTTLVFATL